MRIVVALVVLVACGKKPAGKDDGPMPPPGDTQSRDAATPEPMIDAAPAEPLAACTPTAGSNVSVVQIAKIQQSVVLATSPPFDGRLFVVEQRGRIDVLDNTGKLLPTPFLDLRSDIGGPVVGGGELGLLGLAFDPAYADNHQLYIYYTGAGSGSGDPYVDVVARYTTSGSDANIADPTTALTILAIPDFATNHNGGMIEFGSDHDLYVGTGDGGSEGDPRRVAQNASSLLGKMLRIDVHHPSNGKPYGIPSDNPFADGASGAPEVYMIGLRNPWRWSFDRASGDMWIGEVGAAVTEELDYLPSGHQAGANLGWSQFEGSDCCSTEANHCQAQVPQTACDPTGKLFPQITRSHAVDNWDAIIGGQVYRGPCFPDLAGIYFFSDNGFHGLSEATVGSDGTVTAIDLPGTWPQSPSSIHADARGELYETTTTGLVFHIVAGP